jgi:Flp pilus assembly protein TadD
MSCSRNELRFWNTDYSSSTVKTVAQARKSTAKTAAPAAKATFHWFQWYWLLLGAFGISLIVFSSALVGGFVFDDYHLPFYRGAGNETNVGFWIGGVRPVLMLTYWANYLISRLHPLSYHLFNIAIHAANALFVFWILERVLELATFSGNRRRVALFGALCFLVHPLQTESVDYVAGRSELVAAFFFAACWLVFLKGFEKKTSLPAALGIGLLGGLAVLGKESAMTFPAVLLATDLYWGKESAMASVRRHIWLYVVFVFGALAAAPRVIRLVASPDILGGGVNPLLYALSECRAIVYYIRLFLLPIGQNGDWQMLLYRSLTDGAALVYLVGVLGLLAAVVLTFRSNKLVSFGLLLFLVMLSPTSSFMPIKDVLAERRMYLPIVGLIIALIGIASRVRIKAEHLRWATAAALAAFAIVSWNRSEVWTSDYQFWRDSAEKNYSNSRAHYGLGTAMFRAGDCAGAIRELKIASSQEQPDDRMRWNLAEAYQCVKQPEEALRMLKLIPEKVRTSAMFVKIGFLEASSGNAADALDAFDRAIALDAGNADAWAYRGLAKVAIQDSKGASADLRHALGIDSSNETALRGMGLLGKTSQQ